MKIGVEAVFDGVGVGRTDGAVGCVTRWVLFDAISDGLCVFLEVLAVFRVVLFVLVVSGLVLVVGGLVLVAAFLVVD